MSLTLTNVMAISLDGRIGKHALESDGQRRSYGFTNMDDREWVRQQLESADAVITGANSMRASGATWRVKNDLGKVPMWIVLTKSGLESDLRFWQQDDVHRVLVSPSTVACTDSATGHIEYWVTGEVSPPRFILEELRRRGLNRVLLFGGGSINKMFYDAGLVDFAKITLCPLIIGAVSAPSFVDPGLSHDVKMELISSVAKGNLVFLTYKIQH